MLKAFEPHTHDAVSQFIVQHKTVATSLTMGVKKPNVAIEKVTSSSSFRSLN